MDKHPNPVVVARKSLGLSRKGFCALHDVKYAALTYVECGYDWTIPDRIKTAFARAGIDTKKLEADYQNWRRAEAQAELARVKN